MISDINCPKCGVDSPERYGELILNTPTLEDPKRQTKWYLCRCKECGHSWKEKYLEL